MRRYPTSSTLDSRAIRNVRMYGGKRKIKTRARKGVPNRDTFKELREWPASTSRYTEVGSERTLRRR